MVMVVQRDELLLTAMRMLEHVAQCVRRGQHGEWVLLLDEVRHDHPLEGLNLQQVSLGGQFLVELSKASGAGRPAITELPPVNQLPTDPAWVRDVDATAERVAAQLGCLVVLIAAQEHGKAGVAIGGHKLAGPRLAEMVDDMPRFLRTMATVCTAHDEQGKERMQ